MSKSHTIRHAVLKEKEPEPVQYESNRDAGIDSEYQLWIERKNGLIFATSAMHISGIAKFPINNSAYSILISDSSSNEVARLELTPERSRGLYESPFTWDLRSNANSYVISGRYTISLAELSDGGEILRCSEECRVADTRDILATTELLALSERFTNPTSRRVLSTYADIIRDIEIRIIEGLQVNKFDEPYFVARTTAGFVQNIYNDIENESSEFGPLIEKFVLENLNLDLHENKELGIRALYDFLVNYMADPEDQARAMAMIRCEYRNFTANDRSVVLSALVDGILPHCMTLAAPSNLVVKKGYALLERMLRVGIRYVCAKHIDTSISMCRAQLV